ncbi:MAG: ABC transporter permease [Bacteroidetes bacterium]|nr:ABC transporter permease [Fibrella sp.]
MNPFTAFPALLTLLLIESTVVAQTAYDISENQPAVFNGIEYGFSVRNESKKDVGGKAFNRYEVTVFATNKSSCTKLFFPKQTIFGQQNNDLLAQFDCLNATGARLTAKNGSVRAKPFFVPYTTSAKTADNKTVTNTVQVQAGYWLRNGETVASDLILIVPDGEAPRLKVRVQEFTDQ